MPTNKHLDLLHSLKGSQEGLGSVAVQLRGRRGMGGWRVKRKGWVGGWADGRKAGKYNKHQDHNDKHQDLLTII
jgi:hypothetical protein